MQNGRFDTEFVVLETFMTELNELISSSKSSYYVNLR